MTKRVRTLLSGAFLFSMVLPFSAPAARADIGKDLVEAGKKLGGDIEKATKKVKKKVKKAKQAVEDGATTVKKAVEKPLADEVLHQVAEGAQEDEFDGTGVCVKCDGEEWTSRRPDGCSVPKELTDSTTSRGRKVFLPACNRHDRCYQTPGVLQKNCDERFRKGMIEICEEFAKEHPADPFNALCKTTAITWFGFVRGFGSGKTIPGGYQSGQTWAKKNSCRTKKAAVCPKGWTNLDTGKTSK